jgi:VWFA-related protein
MIRRIVGVCLLAVWLSAVPQGSQNIFRSSTDAVLVDVSVRSSGAPVRGLKVSDFVLLDNGVPQKIDSVTNSVLPLDVTLIVDVSASLDPETRKSLLVGVREIASLLNGQDTLEIGLIDGAITMVEPQKFYATIAGMPVRRLADGGTLLFDAVSAAVMRAAKPGRRHLVIALTDGADANSSLPDRAVASIVRKSESIVYIVAVSGRARAWGLLLLWNTVFPTSYDQFLSGLVSDSGGRLLSYSPEQSFASQCEQIVDELRARYVLSYVPSNVDGPGWHAIKVRAGGYEVRARRGYER